MIEKLSTEIAIFEGMKRGVAFLLSLLMLISTTSFSVNAHYCGSILVSFSINGEAQKCSGAEWMVPDQLPGTTVISAKGCCLDLTSMVEGESPETQLDQTSAISASWVTTLPNRVFSGLRLPKSAQAEVHHYHPPPKIPEDLQVLFQTFLV